MGNDALKWGGEQRDGTGINNVCGKDGSLKNDPRDKVPKNPPLAFTHLQDGIIICSCWWQLFS